MKSDIEIKDTFYNMIKGSTLEMATSGILSKKGRPQDSNKEDIVISVLDNGCGQKQEAFVNVNVYIPAVKNEQTRGMEVDDIRCRLLCELSKFLFTSHGDGFRVDSSGSKQRVLEVNGKNEYIINNKLLIQISNE